MDSQLKGRVSAYRITDRRYPPFDGGGAFKWGSRWCSPGRRVIHAASSYALAVLENLVHFNSNELPPQQAFVEIVIPRQVSRTFVEANRIPGWDMPYPNGVSEVIGDEWYDAAKHAILIAPSVLSPFEFNILINQMHRDVARITVGPPRPAVIDHR